MAQELYKNAISTIDAQVVEPREGLSNVSVESRAATISERYRRVSFNFASVILSGDIRVGYEIFDTLYRTWVANLHVNPHPDHIKRTGKYGGVFGMRMYLDPHYHYWYGQFLGGLNVNQDDVGHILLDISVGYVAKWRQDLWMTMGMGLQRAYYKEAVVPEVYAIAQLTFGVQNHLLPF